MKVGIVGYGMSTFERGKRDTHLGEMIYNTVSQTLQDTGMDIAQIETLINASCDYLDGRSISNVFIAEAMGAFLKEESKVEEDGAYALLYAYMRLLTGNFKTALIVGHSKGSECSPVSYSYSICDPFLQKPLGIEAISSSALQASAYFAKYNATEEDAAKVAVKNRKNGLKNENTQIRKEITVNDVMKSPYLASPIKKLDACPITDGCAVVILATEDVAKNFTKNPVWIESVGYCHDLYYLGHRDLFRSESCSLAAKKAYSSAKINNPMKDCDFAEVYEPFSFYELMLYESLGLCQEGEGKKLIQDGTTEINGSFPVNPSGGALCANPILARGLVNILEASKQLTRTAGEHQLKKELKKAIVHSSSGLCLQSNIVYVLSI